MLVYQEYVTFSNLRKVVAVVVVAVFFSPRQDVYLANKGLFRADGDDKHGDNGRLQQAKNTTTNFTHV